MTTTPTTAALTKIAVHREVVAAIQSFTAGVNMFEAANEAASCIIALQTTTAASVLTEDDRRIYNQSMTRYWEKASDELMAARLRAIIDRLTSTVGAPAPAHTKFVAVNSAQDIDDVIADIMKPAKGDTP